MWTADQDELELGAIGWALVSRVLGVWKRAGNKREGD